MTTTSTKQETWEDAVRWLREQPDSAAIVQDAYYDDPLSAAAERYWQSEEWRAVRSYLPNAKMERPAALDIGAGRGIASYALARDGFAVTALEPDPSALVGQGAIRALSNETGLAIEVEGTLSERLPFADARFDLVFARAVLHHIGDLQSAMSEVSRVLKPGGTFMAIREHVISRREDLPAFLSAHPLHDRYGGENALLASEYQKAIVASGLRLTHVIRPLESAVNFGPKSTDEVCDEIARKMLPVPGLTRPIKALLNAPILGAKIRRLAEAIDNRPGRHYSFVAVKPA